jgi:TatD DNase family protein
MIDIGPNLSSEQFNNDLDNVINNAVNANIHGLILTSTDLKTYNRNIKIIENHKDKIFMKTTYGLHPHNAKNHLDIFKNIDLILQNPHIGAIGEFGLDYFRMLSPQNTQQFVMDSFLNTAKNHLQLPLFLHEREAFEDFYATLKNSNVNNKFVVHCFTGNKHNLKKYVDLGAFIGITGWISDHRRNKDLKEALKYLPIDRLMIETDCPYLTPKNMDIKVFRNEPAFLPFVAKSIAEIMNLSVEHIVEQSTKNTLDFFSISPYNNRNTLKVK